MPRRAKTKTVRAGPAVGPYDLSTIKLPGGTELQALGVGFDRERAMQGGYKVGRRDGSLIGYNRAAVIVNRNVLADGHAAWILADSRTGLLRAQTASQLFEGEVKTEMVEQFSDGIDITPTEFSRGHAWKKALGVPKHQPLTGPLKDIGRDYIRLNDHVYLHHRTEALPPAAAPAAFETPRRGRPEPQPQALVPWSPGDYAANFMGW